MLMTMPMKVPMKVSYNSPLDTEITLKVKYTSCMHMHTRKHTHTDAHMEFQNNPQSIFYLTGILF